MPEFDANLNPIALNKSSELPTLPNPATPVPNVPSFGGGGGFGGDGKGVSAFDKYFSKTVPTELLPTVSVAELHANRRYDQYNPYMVDIEDQKSQSQSDWSKAFNAVTKGVGLIGTTVLGLGGLAYGGVKSLLPGGKFSDVYNNEVTRELDDFNTNMDEYWMPNYYSNAEKSAKWYSPDNWFKTNFLFDKLMKNAGYAVGAIYSGNIISGGLKLGGAAIGAKAMQLATAAEASQAFKLFTPLLRNTARAFSVGKNAEVANVLKGELSTVADVEASASAIAEIAKGTNLLNKFNDVGRRSVIAFLSQAGESSFEALQTSKEFRNNLIEEYKAANGGLEPTGQDLNRINEAANSVGNLSFLGNMGILGVTEYIQLPRLLGSSYAAERKAANSLLGETGEIVKKGDKYIAAAPTTKFGKIYEKASRIGGFVFDPKEAGQELSQYALQVGTQNYFKKAYESDDATIWTDLVMYGYTGRDERGRGVGALVSKEGMESMVLGGLTGGPMQIRGKLAQGKALKSNTETFLDQINNAPTFRDAFKERLVSANRGIVLQQQQQDAVLQGDKLEAKDLDADMMHNYLAPRIKYGRFDMVMGDISDLRQQGATEKGLTALKQEGFANVNDTIESYGKRLANFEKVAKNLNEIYRSYDLTYSGVILTDKEGKPILNSDGKQQRKYSPLVIDKMVYAASKVADYDVRIPQVNSSLVKAGINTQDVIDSIIKDGKPNKEATAKALNDINNLDVLDTVKDELKSDLSDVIELSLRRKMFMKEHNDIKEKPLNYELAEGYGYDIDEKDKTPVDVVQKEIDAEDKRKETTKKLEIGKEYSLQESLRKENGKLTLAPKITVLSQTLGGELEVKLPNGKTTFLSPEQFKSYNISDENNTSQEMADILDEAIDTVLKEDKYKDVKKELPKLEEGQKLDKVGWVNSLDNQDLIDDVEKEFDRQTKEIIETKERQRKEAEQLKKNKEDIAKQQNEIEQDSGDVNTNNPANDKDAPEGKIPNANILFISGTSESEEKGYYIDENGNAKDPLQAAIHLRNQREFLNNVGGFKNRKDLRAILVTAKLQKAYGLDGLVEMSYNKPLSEIPDVESVDDGFVAQVFVEQVGDRLFFVDKNGNQIGEVGVQVENLSDVIFQTMRTTKTEYKDGTPRYRKDQKEEAKAYAKAWAEDRATRIFSIDPSASPVIYNFQVSRGIAEKGEDSNHVAGTLINKSNEAKLLATDQTLIQIPTAGVIAHHTGQINMPNGRPVLVHQDNVEFLNNIQFKGKRAQAIYEAINKIATEINEQSKAGKKVVINKKLSRFLQNVLYWRKGSTTEGSNQINITEDGTSISFSGKTYAIPEIATRKNELIEDIEKAFHNVNNDSLSADVFSKPFMEYYIDEDGKLSEEPREWNNYQTYLLSSTYPDGSARSVADTPLSTKIKKPTDEVPYTHNQKYSTLIGLDLPVGVIAKPEKKAEPTPASKKERKYDYDGETVNIFTTKFGKAGEEIDIEIEFTVKEGEAPVLVPDSTINDATLERFIGKVKKIKPEFTDEEATVAAAGNLKGLLAKELESDVVVSPEAPVAQPAAPVVTPAPTAPVSTDANIGYISVGGFLDQDRERVIKNANDVLGADIEKLRNTLEDFFKKNNLSFEEGLAKYDTPEYQKKAENYVKPRTTSEFITNQYGQLIIPESGTESNIYAYISAYKNKNERLEKFKNPQLVKVISTSSVTGKVTKSEPYTQEIPSVSTEAKVNVEVESTETPKEPGSFNVKNVKKRGNLGFRKVSGLDKTDRMTEADYEVFKKWHAEKVPNIPFEALEQMINISPTQKAWGVAENGVAKFVRGGLRGTEYHEIGEVIWNWMLSPEQRAAILADERKRSGKFTDRETGRKYNYDDPSVSDKIMKERIWDDFSDYRLGKLPARTLGEKVRRFFKMIMDFFKSFVTKPSLKEDLFKAIDTGKFKDRQLSAESKSMPPQYRAAGHLTEEQTNAYVKDMTSIASAIILGNGKRGTIDKSAIFNLRSLTSDDVFSKVEEIYEEQGLREEFGDITWKDLVDKTKQELKVLLKVDFNEEDLININDSETNRNDYAKEPFSTDYKKSAPVGIKFVSATLPETVPTNQENSNSFKLPDPKVNPKTETFSLVPYTRVFNTMLDKLKNTASIKKVVNKLIKLAEQDANYVRMFKALGGFYSTNLEGKMEKTINFKNFKFDDWRLFVQMMQTYTKQKPDAVIQYVSQGQVNSRSAMVTDIVNVTTRGWIQNMRSLAKEPDSYVTYNSGTGTYSITDLSGIPTNTPQEKEVFLSKLGISFPVEAFNKLKEPQQKEFTLAVASLKRYLQDAKEIMNIKKKTLDVAGQYDTLAELLVSVTHPNMETIRFNLKGKQSNSYADSNAPSILESEFNEVETLDELLKLRPELNDIYSKNSVILKKGGLFFDKQGKRTSLQLKVGYIEGTKYNDDNKGITSVDLNKGARFTQEINQNLLGQYYIMIPADGSTEWMMNLGNHIAFEDVEQGTDGWKQINKIFRGYLTDEVALALDADNRKQLKNVGNLDKIAEIESKLETLNAVDKKSDAQKEEIKKLNAELEYLKKKPYDLRFFKDVLSEKVLSGINEMIAEERTQEDIEKYIDDNIDSVNASIKQYLDGRADETIQILMQNGQIELVKKDDKSEVDYYKYPMLNDSFAKNESINKNNLTLEEIRNIVTFANVNYEINNTEFHKILFGDPYQFAIKNDETLDATKRFKSFLSPRRKTIDAPEFNTFLNEEMNRAGDVELQPGDPGYHEFKSWMDTVTVNDVTIAGSVANMKNVSEEVKKAFAKTNEGDASSIIMDGTYREMKIKNGQWNDKGAEEAWHQWQMAFTRQNLPSSVFKYSNDARGKALEAHDKALLKTKEPKHVIEVVKPIVSGVTNGTNNIKLVLDKDSQMPLYYSMVKGTNLENLYIKMMKEKKAYIIMISGRKVGAEAIHDLYTQKGEFNDAAFNNNVEVTWKSYGVQVETSYEGGELVTKGSQATKLSTLDLYENGEPIGATDERKEEIAKEVKRNNDLLDKLHQNGYERLLKKLGVEDLGGSYKIVDKRALAKSLQDEIFRRELSDNIKDSVQVDEDGEFPIPFEASPAYLQIKSILYSFIDKEITSQKVYGGAYVQAPVTLWENAKAGRKIAIKEGDTYKQITRQEYDTYSPEEQKKVVLTDDTLKFYEDEDGERYCQVMLPHWFKGKLGKHANKSDEELIKFLNSTKEGEEILSGIGFRIPTQSLSSIEAFKVKGFLPQYMGKTVIVPSEITTKAGSDFDIDKLNMYLKAVYVDKYGDIKIAKLKETEEATREFYGKVFDDKLENQKLSKAELLEALDIFTYELEDPKNLVEKYIHTIESFMENVQDAADASDEILKQLEKLGDKNFQGALKQNFVDNMYRRSLENEYYDSLEKLVTFPENFQRLISPVSDDGLKDISDELDVLRGYDETKIKNRLLNRNYMTSLRHAFVTAKRWVGIAAVNITGHSLTQKFKAYIDPARFENVPLADRKILKYGNGEVLLDHNKIEKDGKSYISLSGRFDGDGKFISDGLSGFATAFVDVAKDPYILKIIKSDLAVGTFMFLRRIGVPKKQLIMFMNQPIIDEYLTMLDNKGVRTLFDSRYITAIQNKFPSIEAFEVKDLEGFNKEELADNIKNYYATKDLGDYKNFEQVNIFYEFLKYAKMAEYNFKFTQASNYDTTKFQSGDSLQLKQWRTEGAQNKNIISSVGELLEKTFIGVQANILDKSMDAMGEVLPLEQPKFTSITNEVLRPYEQDLFLGKDKFDKIANKIKAAFLDYVIQKRSDVATNLQQQLVDDKKSVAQMLVKAKQTYPNVQLIQDLEVDSSGRIGGAQTIKLKVNEKIAYNENMYQGMMRELRDDPNTNALYKGIVRLAILQGTYQSAISIKNVIPVEDYASHITPIISSLQVDDELRAFATSNEFQRNEWQDNDVVPILEPRFKEVENLTYDDFAPRQFQAALVKLQRGDRTVYVPGPFPSISELNVKSSNRQILLVNTKYQAKASNYDVIKVPRAVSIDKKKAEEGKIDVATGLEITNQTYAEKIKKGDTSLQNYYGYQKVKYADGSPVVASYDGEGNPVYVYKFINLHGDGMYATEYYGDGRPSIFNNGSQKNVKNVGGTLISNEIPDQDIINYYGGESVPLSEADPITATIEKESENVVSSQPSTSVEGTEVAPEVRYKDKAKRIRIEYPSKISQGSLYNDLNSNELIQLSRIEHSSNIAEQIEIYQDYAEAIAKKYGGPAGDYVGETESEITIEEAEFLRDHPQFAKDFIEGFLNSELGDGKTMQDYAQALLDQNERLVDTAQMSLFDPNNEDLEGADEPNPCGQ